MVGYCPLKYTESLCDPLLRDAKSVHAVHAGSAGHGFHLDGIKGEAVPDIGDKDADALLNQL